MKEFLELVLLYMYVIVTFPIKIGVGIFDNLRAEIKRARQERLDQKRFDEFKKNYPDFFRW